MTKRIRIRLCNDFHSTQCVVFARDHGDHQYTITDAQFRAAERALCPKRRDGCCCQIVRGEGMRWLEIDPPRTFLEAAYVITVHGRLEDGHVLPPLAPHEERPI